MIGLLVTPIKVQLGPMTNGFIIGEKFIPASDPTSRRGRCAQTLPGEGRKLGHRSLGHQFRSVRLCRGPSAGAVGGRN